jgi:dimethylamine/trimethylamine dehydrogenase
MDSGVESQGPADERFAPLFEPLKIGPVTAPNRFYQVPHCTGMGWLRPQMLAELRAVKAEGGWGVVNTEYCSIHPSSDDLPHPYASLWDRDDIRFQAAMTEKVHAAGSLAGVELWHGGARATNLFSREVGLDVASLPNLAGEPFQTRAMDKQDIRAFRQWHREAALRAKEAGFDVVYVYATHGYLLSNFLSPVTNRRDDAYGGTAENRLRLLREVIEETKEAVGEHCAVAVRFSVDYGGGADGEPRQGHLREAFERLAELPDLWDLNVADYSFEMGVSRFVESGSLEPYVAFAKSVTSKPVVTVGRFTSPDAMLSQIKRGIVDLIGAARPSIADPFLPRKIREDRLEEIRECIGCNICYTGDGRGVPIRCTQNPTMGEEWRRGWHPERIAGKRSEASVLVVGAGPAGLEAARALGQRGYRVTLAEAGRTLGGRVTREAALPGLSEWARVRDYREQQLLKMANVEIYRESALGAEDILAFGAEHVALALGAAWRADGAGRSSLAPLPGLAGAERVFTPDDVMAGRLPEGRVLLYDDDQFYLGAVLAEKLAREGVEVLFVTPGDCVSAYGVYTVEQARAQARLLELGVTLFCAQRLKGVSGREATLACDYSGKEQRLACDSLLLVTARQPNDSLYFELREKIEAGAQGGPKTLRKIGDCDAPGLIAAAVYAGHRYARELEEPEGAAQPLRDRAWQGL